MYKTCLVFVFGFIFGTLLSLQLDVEKVFMCLFGFAIGISYVSYFVFDKIEQAERLQTNKKEEKEKEKEDKDDWWKTGEEPPY